MLYPKMYSPLGVGGPESNRSPRKYSPLIIQHHRHQNIPINIRLDFDGDYPDP